MTDLHDLSALEQAAAIRRREIRPSELVEHYLERIESLGASLGAFVTTAAQRAIETAKRLEAEIPADAEAYPLFGVPSAIKDLNLVQGERTTFGSRAFTDFVAPIDDYVVAKARDAGLVLLGKTNTPEFGLACYTEPDVAPPARSPFDLSRSAGGSSGGAGAAVAGGLVALAHGSDGAGSIRIPASACGLVGLKPSRGRISHGPVMADTSGLSVSGAIARTVGDAAALLDALTGQMPGDPYWAPPLAHGETFLGAARLPVPALRIGICREPIVAGITLHPHCVAAFEDAAALLEALGHRVEPCAPAFSEDLVEVFETIWTAGAATIPLGPAQEALVRPLTRWLRERGRALSGPSVYSALGRVQLAARSAVASFSTYDAVLTPTLAQPPALVGALRNDADPEADFEAQKRFTPFAATANLTGQPAISLPLYWTAQGLPIGVQLVGRPAGEAGLLGLAAQLEAARPWRHRVPACW